MKKPKPSTVGEKEVLEILNGVNQRYEPYTLGDLRNQEMSGLHEWRYRARRIDSALKRAAREARKEERKYMATVGAVVASKAALDAAWDAYGKNSSEITKK